MPLSLIVSRLTWKPEDIPGVLEVLRTCLRSNPLARPTVGKLKMIII